MNPARIIIVLVAGVAAVALALVVRTIATKPAAASVPIAAAPQQAGPPMTRVLVAKIDLVPGDRLAPENMAWQAWPVPGVNTAYVTDGQVQQPNAAGALGAVKQVGSQVADIAAGGGPKMQEMVGAIVREPLFAGEPITARKVVRSGDSGYMAVRLPPGTRAMSLPINAETGAGGFIQPGDRVDVLSTHADPSRPGAVVTEVILPDAKVLAIDQHTDAPKSGSSTLGATITFEVPVDAVMTVARARSQGGLYMALRSYADIGQGGAGPSARDQGSVRMFKGGGTPQLVAIQ